MIRAGRPLAVIAALTCLTSCGGSHGSVAPSVPIAPTPIVGSVTKSNLSLTVVRSSLLPSSGRKTAIVYASTSSIEIRVWSGATTGGTPVTSACSNFPAGASNVTITVGVPIGLASVKISAYDGACSGTAGTGNVLSDFAATGTVLASSTTVADVFNAGRPVTLGRVLPMVADTVPPANLWQVLGPRNYDGAFSGKLNSFALLPSGRALFAGGFGHGYEVGTEGGVFAAASLGSPLSPADHGLTDPTVNDLLVTDPGGSTILAATQFGGIFRSTDAGASWKNVYAGAGAYGFTTSAGTIYAGLVGGVAESPDGGASWTKTLSLAASTNTNAVAAVGATILAGTSDGTIYARTTSGWNAIGSIPAPGGGNPGLHTLAIDPLTPTTVLASVNGGVNVPPFGFISTQLLYRSLDAGATWTQVTLPATIRGAQAIAASKLTPHLFYVAGTELYTTVDAGATFVKSPGYTGDSRGLTLVTDGTTESVYIASDEGLSKFANDSAGGSTFYSVGISNNVVYDVAAAGTTILTAVQDYSPLVSLDAGASWTLEQPTSGLSWFEDGVPYIHPASAQNCYLWDGGGFHASFDGCKTFVMAAPIALPSGAFASGELLAGDPTNAKTLFAVTASGVEKSVDAGLTFAPTGWPIVHPVSISIGSDGKAIFVVSASNGLNSLVVSSDGGATFAQSNLPASYEIALASSPRDPAIVLASLVAPYSANPLATYRSTDGGLSFQPLSNTGLVTGSTHRRTFVRGAIAEASQPRIFPWDGAFSVNAFGSPTPAHLRFAPGTTTAAPWVALTTTTGAYVSSDYGDHWHDIGGDAIPHAFYGAAWLGNRLVVSTAGEGVLESVPLF